VNGNAGFRKKGVCISKIFPSLYQQLLVREGKG
jgi:hypothetical protein